MELEIVHLEMVSKILQLIAYLQERNPAKLKRKICSLQVIEQSYNRSQGSSSEHPILYFSSALAANILSDRLI
jgi:hypothetical protein